MLAFERACADDPELAAEFARLKALDEALRRAAPIEPAPARFAPAWRRWRAAQRASGAEISFPPPPRALAASLLLGALLGYGGALSAPAPPPQDERALVSAFMRAQIGGQSVDVATSDRHVVKPWLAGRAPLAVAAVDLASSGFPLVGGRVEALDGRIVADPGLSAARTSHRGDGTAAGRQATDIVTQSGFEGYHLARWSDADRAYVAVTDLPAPELADFVTAFRAAVAAEREEPRAK